jgi:hypothetical protein
MRVSQSDPGSVVSHDIRANELNTYFWLIEKVFFISTWLLKVIFAHQNFLVRVTTCHVRGIA